MKNNNIETILATIELELPDIVYPVLILKTDELVSGGLRALSEAFINLSTNSGDAIKLLKSIPETETKNLLVYLSIKEDLLYLGVTDSVGMVLIQSSYWLKGVEKIICKDRLTHYTVTDDNVFNYLEI